MPSPLTVKNDFRRERCPFCDGALSRVGALASGRHVRFSTHEVELALAPELARCDSCGSAFVQNAIPETTARELYSSGDGRRWTDPRPFEQTKTREAVRVLERIVVRGTRVLDVGCNTGELLDFARARGAQTAGVELSSASREICAQKGHAACASLAEAPGEFDVITAFDLVEHVHTLPALLAEVAHKLAPDGRLVALTGDIDCPRARRDGASWWYVQPPEHVVFPSILALAGTPGMRVEDIVRTFAAEQYVPRAWRRAWDALRGRATESFDHVIVVLRKKGAQT